MGDLHIDAHHTVEDTGITLGMAVAKAIGDRKGIRRYGHAYVPLDEALSRVVVDFSSSAIASSSSTISILLILFSFPPAQLIPPPVRHNIFLIQRS